MAKLEELDLPADAPKDTLDTEQLPEQFGKSLPSLYPASYQFKLPINVGTAFDAFMITSRDKAGEPIYKDVEVEGGQTKKVLVQEHRIAIVFDEDHPLEVVMTADKEMIGKAYYGRISNAERNRARKNEPKVLVADMLYMLQALGFKGKIANGANKLYIAEVIKFAGHSFVADVEWSAYSNPNSTRYIYPIINGAHDMDQTIEDPDGKPGSGKRWYQKAIPRDDAGRFQERWAFDTGEKDLSGLPILEAVRAFPNLTRFRAVAK